MNSPLRSISALAGILAALLASPLHSQTAVPDQNGRLVFKASARTVVLDVVVTDRDGKPVQGLHNEDFHVAEDGSPQAIAYFEEHSGAHPLQVEAARLPPNIFTNVPSVKPSDAVTVLLLDSMNTQLADQSRVHAQMLTYLKSMQTGTRMAIFALGNRLTFIQGFTDDPALLAAALRDPKLGAGPRSSPLLQSQGEVAANLQAPALMQQSVAENGSPGVAAAVAALRQFQAEQTASQTGLRVQTTLAAFQQLAAYLAGIPGRKNVIWFSSAFPLVLFPNAELTDSFAAQRGYQDEVRKTDALLASAQVAIYPVAAEGIATGSLYDSDQRFGVVASGQMGAVPTTPPAGGAPGQSAQIEQESKSVQYDALQRNAGHTAMDEIASATGGAAYYNTNGLAGAVARVVDQGSYFYTMTYTPTNSTADGKFRKIQVRLAGEEAGKSYKLSYRRGYYAEEAKERNAAAAKPAGDPLHPYMGPGMPASTQIPLALRVQRIAAPTAAGKPSQPAPAGDNPNLKAPLTRYQVDFVVAASGLQLDAGPDGSRHGKIESTIVIYSREGQALNWMVRQVDLDMDAARYAQVKANGVNFTLEIDVPANDSQSGISLRGGVFDVNANLAGTLELPLSRVVDSTKPGPAQASPAKNGGR